MAVALHVGCGYMRFIGCINIDCVPTKVTDLVADIRHLPFKDNTVDHIECHHTIEHIRRWEVLATLKDWLRILKRGRKAVIEYPDFDQNCRDYLAGKDVPMQLAFIYGGDIPELEDQHHMGYNFQTLGSYLHTAGFINMVDKPAQDYHTKQAACLRIEAEKR
ncbi:methyltransferase domain-containing protein [Candidatus Aerophobetes bacterium]|uniref:Methyltransferase domain-containing protein n=1 Tax=Aerophobetes bacterium TaxID=2030807 RepID=A0A523S5U6_UNCAE|nr:MAG: methyltransferase domain-containing protein [Candidatus Aerophobetes bacterium]